ncbi:MAG: hypothetical protein ACRDNH_02260 [Gaiellaceae bacterium]|jgi:hypothetical protein
MCHHLTWEEWQLLQVEERREDEEPRTVEVAERERVETETERDPERELVHA